MKRIRHRWRNPWAYPVLLALFGLAPRLHTPTAAASFDAAPFAVPLPASEGTGLFWEDPRELHEVTVNFQETAPPRDHVHLEYWGSPWPEHRLPKDREPGGGDVGWFELGNWWTYSWRRADADLTPDGTALHFKFRPVSAREFPALAGYPAEFRFTLKVRVVGSDPLPAIRNWVALTDSRSVENEARVVWQEPAREPAFFVFNGGLLASERPDLLSALLHLRTASNPDPNSFDRTLVTVTNGPRHFTFRYDDLADGPLFVPYAGAAVLPPDDHRTYAEIAKQTRLRGAKTLRERIEDRPEQSWTAAWNGMPPKVADIIYPLGLDGGRQRFRLNPDGGVDFRTNDHFLRARPGADTPRLDLEADPVQVRFGLPARPSFRTLADGALPMVTTRWQTQELRIEQSAFVTELAGMPAETDAPPGDVATVWMARFTLTTEGPAGAQPRDVELPVQLMAGGKPAALSIVPSGDHGCWLQSGDRRRGWLEASGAGGDPKPEFISKNGRLTCHWTMHPGDTGILELRLPYVIPALDQEFDALRRLSFGREQTAVTDWWRRRLQPGARLITPEPMLNDFYRSHAMHLLVNCEREPGSDRRFARVGSFSYGAYGNESCMMVQDLDRRGFHTEARECLDGWLRYQGTVALPGSFAGKDGVLYGAGGYEAGGYNQHHGWILWMLAEHYRYTRDAAWLRTAAPGMVQACDWILRESARTADRLPLERGLLPAGSLEDIGDWWTWLSTSCYTWRGLDNAAWALGEVGHPDAGRLRLAAANYHRLLLDHFRAARDRSPVVRLRNGTAVPKFPSQVHRRGRSFGWICETLEGSLHLLVTRALDAHSQEADWILDDYEDNLYLSNQYGYTLDDFDRYWFDRGGMSMQACLLLQVEPWLYRDDIPQALRALFNAEAASYFPDVRMNTEHALPQLGDWRGDHFKTSDEANAAGWLRQLFVREDNEQTLLFGQAVPRGWLAAGRRCGLENGATWFGPVSILYTGEADTIEARLDGPRRNPPRTLRVRFREPGGRPLRRVLVNGQDWTAFHNEWVDLPGNIGHAEIRAAFAL